MNEEEAAATPVCKGTTYYFCALHCKTAFDDNPEEYLEDETGGIHGA